MKSAGHRRSLTAVNPRSKAFGFSAALRRHQPKPLLLSSGTGLRSPPEVASGMPGGLRECVPSSRSTDEATLHRTGYPGKPEMARDALRETSGATAAVSALNLSSSR